MRVLGIAPSQPQRSSKDDSDVSGMHRVRPSKTCFLMHPKQFFCSKSPQKESREESNDMDANPDVRDDPVHAEALFNETGNKVTTLPADRTLIMKPTRCHSEDTLSSSTVSSWSHDTGRPSVTVHRVGALDTRLNSIFAEETKKMNHQAVVNAQYGLAHRYASLMGGDWNRTTAPSKHTTSRDVDRRSPPPPVSSFGVGRALKKGAIERRKEELERKFAENRPPAHVKKVKWQVSNKGGGYKKKVYLDYK